MYLSKLEVIGFKSFAQRVNIHFDAGVTAIVGPNGCGKTNIVDAIRWALGEQRYSTLRSDKMEDVIFNGTKNRKPLGLAEVSLSIENTKGILPTEYSEVTITRRVFRSGESEYLLNKVPCRLKDILDLFMDTGMGSDAYSVIELKMVETILSDKTDERRRLFEEAAGVTKYKFRRKAAIRKLESVQQDLARVNDIVKEVQKTVNSLERQAKKAEQYNEVSERLKSMEIDLMEREYAHLNSRLLPLEEKFTHAVTDKDRINEGLRDQEEHIETLRAGLNITENELNEAQKVVATHSETIHRLEEKLLVMQERRTSLAANIDRYEKEKSDLHAQEDVLGREKHSLQVRKGERSQELAEAEAVYNHVKEEHQLSAARMDAKKAEVKALEDSVLAMAHGVVQKRGERDRVLARIEDARGRFERSRQDAALYQEDIKRNEEGVASLTVQDKDLRRRFIEAEMQVYDRQQSKKQLEQEVEQNTGTTLQLKHEIDRKKAAIAFLRSMLEGNEGFPEGARYLLASEPWRRRNLTTIADIIETEPRYREALEAALSEVAGMLVVDTIDDGYAAVEVLKSENKGRATFLCLGWVPSVKRRGKRIVPVPVVWASDVVRCDKKYRPLMNFLLDDCVIVDSVEAARRILAVAASLRCVTKDGQVITSTGVVRGGSQRFEEGGLIGKRVQIEKLEGEIRNTEGELTRVAAMGEELAKRREDLEKLSGTEIVKGIEKEMTAIEMRIAQLEFEKKRANDGIERCKAEMDALGAEVGDLERERSLAEAECEGLERQKADLEGMGAATAAEFQTLERDWGEKTKALNETEIRAVTIGADVRNMEHDLIRADARLSDIAVTLQRRDEEIIRAGSEIGRIDSEGAQLREELVRVRSEHATAEQKKTEIETAYTERRNELHQVELRMKDERRLHDESVSAAHELEMKISELRSGMDHLHRRAEEEFEIQLALKTYPEDEWVDFAQLREEVKNLKERIRILGAINFAAFDEYSSESERLTFLTQQRDDLLQAEKTLMDTIEEINNTAQRKFLETFMKIRENFISIFKELFMEGDECDLRLEENIDPLEANIEIIAKPRGKRPTSIDLLSGGEKTLTAIALLFAIYLVKPSPFCILDEVDAPLDDSNIDRYTRILSKFSDNTQFIVVTHNKRTMEAASALYGVTMEEEGVSKIVTVRFNEEARVRSATVTT